MDCPALFFLAVDISRRTCFHLNFSLLMRAGPSITPGGLVPPALAKAGAGPTVMSQGLAIMSYVFKRLIDAVRPRFDTPRRPMDLRVFEAMVSGDEKPEKLGHETDALAAEQHYANGKFYEEGSDVLSLATAALHWAGYEVDVRLPVYVVKT